MIDVPLDVQSKKFVKQKNKTRLINKELTQSDNLTISKYREL